MIVSTIRLAFRNGSASDTYPTWSPDGTKLAFARWEIDESIGLFVVNADGTDVRKLADGSFIAPEWSPDGQKILYEGNGLMVVNADGNGQTVVRPGDEGSTDYPAWSPDGSQIAFVGSIGPPLTAWLFTMSADGSDVRALMATPGGASDLSWGRFSAAFPVEADDRSR